MDFLKSQTPLSAKTALVVLSVLMFFFSAQVSLTIYVDSSYLEQAITKSPTLAQTALWQDPEAVVGTLYSFASLITILGLVLAPRVLRRQGNYRWTLSIIILHILLLLGLALFDAAWLIIPMFIVETALVSILYFNFDVFLERYSRDGETGVIRGLFLVIGSIAWLLPPFFAGSIIEHSGYQLVYLSGAAIMVPTVFIMFRYFSDFQDLAYDDVPVMMSHAESAKHPDIGHILGANFFLHFFYALMIIYAPLYFLNHLNISHEQFGLMLTIALSAFIIFPYPAGWLADKVLGEKELLVGGFLLMAISAALIPIIGDAPIGIMLWALVLFVGRAGASIVESMAEAYFFKKIDGHNAGLIGYFRRSRPLAFIVAPIIASILMKFEIIELSGLFYVLAAVMLIAIYFPLRLRDTK